MPASLLLTVLPAAVLALSAPGDATRLEPDPGGIPGAGVEAPAEATPSSPEAPDPGGIPLLPMTALGAAAAVMAGAATRRPGPGDALALEDAPTVVFVPGHGTTPDCFGDLARLMELEPDGFRVFDYRWVVETTSHSHASQAASIDATADALNAYLAGLADGSRDVYLVGFSKGGAAIAELVSRWDDGIPAPVEGVTGAALLEPPISGGFQGTIQSLGRFVGPIPDDGGYDPRECHWTRLFCTDNRDHLGEGAGVEVMVLRNPKAGITTFDDRPEGLRVYDVPDEGRGPLASLLHNPFSYPSRIAEAHEAVLHDPRVADCIRSEMASPGSCDLSAPREPLVRHDGSGGGGAVLMAE